MAATPRTRRGPAGGLTRPPASAAQAEAELLLDLEKREERRAELVRAIKIVYASTYNPAAREYKRKHGIQWGGERMAVLIQPIEGRRYGNMFYPELAGAAFSKVFRRPSPRIRTTPDARTTSLQFTDASPIRFRRVWCLRLNK